MVAYNFFDQKGVRKMAQKKFIIDGGFETSHASEIKNDLTMTGNILPSANETYDLGSSTMAWKDVYVGPGSLYVNGKKVLEDDGSAIVVNGDADQSLTIKTQGSGVLTMQSATTISMAGTLQMAAGKKITDASGTAVVFGDKIDADSNKIINVGTPTDNTDVANKSYVDQQVSDLINGAPGALDTLNELAAAMGDDANFSTTITNSIATKAAQTSLDSTNSDLSALTTRVTALETLLANVTASGTGIRVAGPIISTGDVTAFGS